MSLRTKAAFSLVELLIVIMITATIGSVIIGCFMGGMRAYQRVDEFGRNEVDAYIAFEMIERDLKNIVRMREVPFVGERTIMQFPALNVIEAADDAPSEVNLVRYVYTRYGGLTRSVNPLADGGGGIADGESITEAESEASFAYGGAGEDGDAGWLDVWPGGSNLPRRVRIRFQSGGDKGGTLEQVIVIPVEKSDK